VPVPGAVASSRGNSLQRAASVSFIYGISKQIILGKTFVEQQFHYSWLTMSDFACSSA